jgi:hypothetical protein
MKLSLNPKLNPKLSLCNTLSTQLYCAMPPLYIYSKDNAQHIHIPGACSLQGGGGGEERGQRGEHCRRGGGHICNTSGNNKKLEGGGDIW